MQNTDVWSAHVRTSASLSPINSGGKRPATAASFAVFFLT
jgi:hypothetical protein